MSSIEIAYQTYCRKRFPLPTERQIAALEERIDASFPDDYRRYLLQYNGGIFDDEHAIVTPVEGRWLGGVHVMSGIGATSDCAELGREVDLVLFSDNDPPQVVPIGRTGMGDLILLITHPEDCGCIVFKRLVSDECFFLGEGIEEFFSMLREPLEER